MKKATIAGNTFLFTGKLTEFTREEAEAHVEAEGGKVLSGVSAKLNYLVVGEDAGSKLAKAEALGSVTILHEKEFLKMMHSAEKVSKQSVTDITKTRDSEKPATKIISNKVSNDTTYEEVKIGKQIWMAKNLDVTHFRNGDPIPEVNDNADWEKSSDLKTPAWCYFKCKESSGAKFGKLYNWHAVNDKRGIAPDGWRIPTANDWKMLNSELGEKAGCKLKSKNGWEDKGNGNNETKFNALPGSNDRNGMGKFSGASELSIQKGYVYLWAADEDPSDDSWANYVYLTYDDDDLHFDTKSKGFGLSIRCIKLSKQ